LPEFEDAMKPEDFGHIPPAVKEAWRRKNEMIQCLKCGEFYRNCKCPPPKIAPEELERANAIFASTFISRVCQNPPYHPAWGTLTSRRLHAPKP
jgi:hypothetical protein